MTRHPSLLPLSRDHHFGLVLAQMLKINAPIYPHLPDTLKDRISYLHTFFTKDLLPHFKKEELLFPFIKKLLPALSDLTDELEQEHNSMRKFQHVIYDIHKEEELKSQLNEFGMVLEKHIRKEERVLFEQLQKKLTEEQLVEIGKMIKEI